MFLSATTRHVLIEQEHMHEVSLQEALGPAKRSLRVNINTAASRELESLPGIGPSRAQVLIDHRPYSTTDDLLKLPGITARLLDEMRPFITIDMPTEKIATPTPSA